MNLWRIFFSLLLIMKFSFAQDKTIIAIGEAEVELENIHFSPFVFSQAPLAEVQKSAQEFLTIIKEDFSFYAHRYRVFISNKSYSQSGNQNPDGLNVVLKLSMEKDYYKGEIEIFKNNSLVHNLKNIPIYFNLGRKQAHSLANNIYKLLNNRDSIFEKKIIYVSDRNSTNKNSVKELYEMDFDGENNRRITFKNSIVVSPAISNDNSKYLYSIIETTSELSSRGQRARIQNLNLYEFDVRSGVHRLISNRKGLNSGAIYNADGSKIILTLTLNQNADLFEMDLNSKALRPITNHSADDVDPSLSFDGKKMTFLSTRPGKAMIYVLNPIGLESEVKRIGFVGQFNSAPRFSPTGDEIVFSSWVDESFDLFKINSDGTNLVRLTKNYGSNEEASFSPDGEFIIFTSQKVISKTKADQNLVIMNKEGEILKILSKGGGRVFSPRFTN